jgi:hypothetical protein
MVIRGRFVVVVAVVVVVVGGFVFVPVLEVEVGGFCSIGGVGSVIFSFTISTMYQGSRW